MEKPILEAEEEQTFKIEHKGLSINLFMNDRLRKNSYYNGALDKLSTLLRGYKLVGDVSLLPDLTDSNTLPIGTTVTINSDLPINPAFIGMDIGCGYNFFSAAMNPKRFFKKGKLKKNSTSGVLGAIGSGVNTQRKTEDPQFGTIGKGNHFIDMLVLDEIYDADACEEWGIGDAKRTYFLIHTGSRKVGFEVNAKFSELFKRDSNDSGRFNEAYINAFNEAKKYAKANRAQLKQIIELVLAGLEGNPIQTHSFYDKTHNDIEVQKNGATTYKLKKGTSNLKPGEIFVIPGTCTDFSYIVMGLQGIQASDYTINHGAGRRYTRAQIFSKFRRKNFGYMFKDVVLNVDPKRMIEEIPTAYKSIEEVINSVEDSQLAKKIARLRPVGVIVDRD